LVSIKYDSFDSGQEGRYRLLGYNKVLTPEESYVYSNEHSHRPLTTPDAYAFSFSGSVRSRIVTRFESSGNNIMTIWHIFSGNKCQNDICLKRLQVIVKVLRQRLKCNLLFYC